MIREPGKQQAPLDRPLILVEGRDETHFVEWLASNIGIAADSFESGPVKRDALRRELSAIAKTPGFASVRRLCIMLDADDDGDARFASIQDALRHAGLPVPDRQFAVVSNDSIAVQVGIIAGSNGKGEIEDLCLQAVTDDIARQCSAEFIETLLRADPDRISKRSRRQLRAYFAGCKELDNRLGINANMGGFNPDHPALEPLRNVLRWVAGESPSASS
jgi:hypothetical protein